MIRSKIDYEYVELKLSRKEVFLLCNCADEAWNRMDETETQAIMGVKREVLEEISDYLLETLEEMKSA